MCNLYVLSRNDLILEASFCMANLDIILIEFYIAANSEIIYSDLKHVPQHFFANIQGKLPLIINPHSK